MSKKSKEKKLNNLLDELEGVEKTIEEFEVNPIIIQYKNLKLKRTDLNSKIYGLKYDIKMDKLKRCRVHYLVGNKDGHYCLKCGYTTSYKKMYEEKSPERIAIANYRYKNSDIDFIHKYVIDVKLAQKIYNRIFEVNPGIDSKKAIKYFEIALDNMIDGSWARTKNRAKRLGVKRIELYKIPEN